MLNVRCKSVGHANRHGFIGTLRSPISRSRAITSVANFHVRGASRPRTLGETSVHPSSQSRWYRKSSLPALTNEWRTSDDADPRWGWGGEWAAGEGWDCGEREDSFEVPGREWIGWRAGDGGRVSCEARWIASFCSWRKMR